MWPSTIFGAARQMCLGKAIQRQPCEALVRSRVVGFGDSSAHESCGTISAMEQQELIEKIKRLPPDSVAEVEDFVDSLARREGILDRKSLHKALTSYAIQHAGTDADLDSDLEAATTDHLLQQNPEQ
jgi:hypothetical protein